MAHTRQPRPDYGLECLMTVLYSGLGFLAKVVFRVALAELVEVQRPWSGFRVQGLQFSFGLGVWDMGFGFWGLGFGGWGSGFGVWD